MVLFIINFILYTSYILRLCRLSLFRLLFIQIIMFDLFIKINVISFNEIRNANCIDTLQTADYGLRLKQKIHENEN